MQHKIKLQNYIHNAINYLTNSPNSWIKENSILLERLRQWDVEDSIAEFSKLLKNTLLSIDSEERIGTFAFLWDDADFDCLWIYLTSDSDYQEWIDPDLGEYDVDASLLIAPIFEGIEDWKVGLRNDLDIFQKLWLGIVELIFIDFLKEDWFNTIKVTNDFIAVSNFWHDTEYELFYDAVNKEEMSFWLDTPFEEQPKLVDISEIKTKQKAILFGNDVSLNTKMLRGDRVGWGVIPNEIQLFKKLKEVDLNNENIKELPDTLFYLEELEKLNLNHNKIKFLPKQLEKLKNLKQLDLSNNQLKVLPDELTTLNRLESLSLSSNNLEKLPREVKALSNLSFLDLNTNLINKIPDLPISITWLSFLNNQLEELPESFTLLKNLKTVVLTNNKFVSFPLELLSLEAIETIDLGGNYITDIPEEITVLPNFKKLTVYPNAFSLSKREKLRRLFKEKIFLGYDTDEKSFLK